MDHMPGPVECQMFMNELGPDFGGGNHFVFELVPKGKCSMLLSGRLHESYCSYVRLHESHCSVVRLYDLAAVMNVSKIYTNRKQI